MRHRNILLTCSIMLLASLAGCTADTDTALVGVHRALLAQQRGDWEKSIEIRKDVIKRFPEYTYLPDVHFEQAMAYIHLKQDEKAVESFTAAVDLDPEFREAFARRSEVHFRLGNYEQAIEDSNRVIAMGADVSFDMGDLYVTRGDAFLETGDAQRALHNWEVATLLAPQSATPLLRIASYYSDFGQYELALNSLDRAANLDKQNPEIHYQRSRLLVELDRKYEAQAALDKARKLDSEGTLKLPATIEAIATLIQKKKQTHQEQITAKPIPAAEPVEVAEMNQAKDVARKFLKSQGLEPLNTPAQLTDAVVCKEGENEFQVLVKIAKGGDVHDFVLSEEEYKLALQHTIPVGMAVVSEIKFDPKTGGIDRSSGRVIAFAKNWKPDPSRFKPAAYRYHVSEKPQGQRSDSAQP